MDKNNQFTFEEIYEQNNRRIHYHIHKLRINDPHQEFYQEALFAMWNAYKTYEPDKGIMSTYFNYTIKNRLIDLMRKKSREQRHEGLCVQEIGNNTYNSNRIGKTKALIPNQSEVSGEGTSGIMWEEIQLMLTERQWAWVYHYIILDKPIKLIAEEQGITIDAVKSLGRHVRKKLRQNGKEKIIKHEL